MDEDCIVPATPKRSRYGLFLADSHRDEYSRHSYVRAVP